MSSKKEGNMLRFIFIFAFLWNTSIEAKHSRLSLQRALDLRIISTSALSLGSHQGYCARVRVKNLSKDSLILDIEAGRKLNSVDDKNQDILITHAEVLAMAKGETKCVLVKGYCCQASHCSPAENARYTLNKMADTNLVRLAKYLNVKEFDSWVEQNAIWAISDKRSTANITSVCDSAAQALREFVAILKDEPIPWYTTNTRAFVHRNRVFEHFYEYLSGSLPYNNPHDDYVSFIIVDEQGLPTAFIKQEWLMAGSGHYEMHVPIAGIKKGKYVVMLKGKGQVLARKEIEI